jgi:Subtilisin inhibitor-like
MRLVLLTLVTLAALDTGAGGAAGGGSPSRTELSITGWPEGREKGGAVRWTLRCSPAAGTLPRPARACTSLARVRDPFGPVPKGVACTEIYGGPQEALVRGTHEGRRVWTRFSRRDGCQIGRWNRVGFLLGGVATGSS